MRKYLRQKIPLLLLMTILCSVLCIPPKEPSAEEEYLDKTITTYVHGCSYSKGEFTLKRQVDKSEEEAAPLDKVLYPKYATNGFTYQWRNQAGDTDGAGTIKVTFEKGCTCGYCEGDDIGRWKIELKDVDVQNVTPYINIIVGSKEGYHPEETVDSEYYTKTEVKDSVSTNKTS